MSDLETRLDRALRAADRSEGRPVERPILFSAPMVRAILAGEKTQTRRLVKDASGPFWDHAAWHPEYHRGAIRWTSEGHAHAMPRRCPYGEPGDRLWVRETHAAFDDPDGRDSHAVAYRATCRADGSFDYVGADGSIRAIEVHRWTPAIHMRRGDSRILLEITEVRVERLHAITEHDAEAEGVTLPTTWARGKEPTYRHHFAGLWDSINAKRAPWGADPWVWVIGFRRVP